MKPSIRKLDGEWVLTRPPFGFASDPQVTAHGSWKAARRALLGPAPASATSSAERGWYTLTSPGQAGYPRRGTIRMGPESGRKCGCGNWQPCSNPACRPPKLPPPPPPPPPVRGTIRMEDT